MISARLPEKTSRASRSGPACELTREIAQVIGRALEAEDLQTRRRGALPVVHRIIADMQRLTRCDANPRKRVLEDPGVGLIGADFA